MAAISDLPQTHLGFSVYITSYSMSSVLYHNVRRAAAACSIMALCIIAKAIGVNTVLTKTHGEINISAYYMHAMAYHEKNARARHRFKQSFLVKISSIRKTIRCWLTDRKGIRSDLYKTAAL